MHDAEFSHDHEEVYREAVDIEGIEKLTLTSVGIDIGSSTTHLLFSRLTLRREGAIHSGQFKVADREVLWSSPILLTPYLSKTLIDFERIREFIHQAYHAAGLSQRDIDTGAVVITGEALKKENARPIIEHFARDSGKFICASAGPHHEALLAAYGSGAVRLSKVSRSRILNVDMGGGTTKLSLIVDGMIAQTAAINIGARLIACDESGHIVRLEEAGAILALEAGFTVAVGDALDNAARQAIGVLMGQTLIDTINPRDGLPARARQLMITPPIEAYHGLDDIDYIVVSGGVSEYVYRHTDLDFGDLGPVLGQTLRGFLDTLPRGTLLEPEQGIRATVIGASEYTIQVSGATSFFTSIEALPIFGFKVVYVPYRTGTSFADALAAAFRKFDIEAFGPGLVLSLAVEGELEYGALKDIALGVAEAFKSDPSCPAIITIEQDIAKVLGNILKNEIKLANALICIDGIMVGDLDYIDIGKPMSMMDLFPVTVKSLLFSSERLL